MLKPTKGVGGQEVGWCELRLLSVACVLLVGKCGRRKQCGRCCWGSSMRCQLSWAAGEQHHGDCQHGVSTSKAAPPPAIQQQQQQQQWQVQQLLHSCGPEPAEPAMPKLGPRLWMGAWRLSSCSCNAGSAAMQLSGSQSSPAVSALQVVQSVSAECSSHASAAGRAPQDRSGAAVPVQGNADAHEASLLAAQQQQQQQQAEFCQHGPFQQSGPARTCCCGNAQYQTAVGVLAPAALCQLLSSNRGLVGRQGFWVPGPSCGVRWWCGVLQCCPLDMQAAVAVCCIAVERSGSLYQQLVGVHAGPSAAALHRSCWWLCVCQLVMFEHCI